MNFATLHITSISNNNLPYALNGKKSNLIWDFTDAKVRNERRERVLKKLGTIDFGKPLGHHWNTDTDGLFVNENPDVHINWILSNFNKDFRLYHLADLGYEYWFSYCWTGNGSGGGIRITTELTKILNRHKAYMDLGFYTESMLSGG